MIFLLSKILWILFSPFNLILLLIILASIFRFFKCVFFSRIFYLTAILFFLTTGVIPLGAFLMHQLEKNYYNQASLPETIDGILILSGATKPFLTKVHNQVSINSNGERLIESVVLIKKYPKAKVIFSGGSGKILDYKFTHSDAAKIFYQNLEIDLNRINFENQSRNTYENILFSKNIAKPMIDENWILVTSAFHLRRSINISEKIKWKLIPYATDFNQPKEFNWKFEYNLLDNLVRFRKASHEWLGIIIYYLMGRTSKV